MNKNICVAKKESMPHRKNDKCKADWNVVAKSP